VTDWKGLDIVEAFSLRALNLLPVGCAKSRARWFSVRNGAYDFAHAVDRAKRRCIPYTDFMAQ
jgi:hypothetical protein